MPRVHTIKSARKDYPSFGISKGDTYYKWKFRYGGERKSKTYPKRSQLTQSAFYQSLYDLQDDFAFDRDDLDVSRTDIIDQLQDLLDQCQDSLDNMPEHLQDTSESGMMLQERIDGLQEWIDNLEAVEVEIAEEDLIVDLEAEGSLPNDEDFKEKLEDAKECKLDGIIEELESCEVDF